MNKKILLALLAILVIIGGTTFFLLEKNVVTSASLIPIADDVALTSQHYELKEIDTSVQPNQELVGTLTMTVRKVENGDRFVFSTFHSTSAESVSLPLQLEFKNQTAFELYPFSEPLIQEEHDRVFGKDYTTNVKGLYRSTGDKPYELFLSQNYISKELTHEYEDGSSSVLRELINEDQFIETTEQDGDVTFHLKLRTTGTNQISENWFLISDEPLFSDEEDIEYFKSYTNRNFIHSPKWLTATGLYTKLPWSVEPGTKVGYGRNLVSQQGKVFAERYEETPSRFYYDMLVNSVNYLMDFKGDLPLWKTEYTSTWLKGDYGIIAPYIDTRHNENIALFLSRAGKILDDQDIEDSDALYADFLSTQQEIGNTLTTPNGYYILDYYSEHQTSKTHVSLNHALGEMNFLLEMHKKNPQDKYLDTALHIKRAVEDTASQWINPDNQDLWYQINGDYSFEGQDYDTLTLKDLINSLQHFDSLDIDYDQQVFHSLIESKLVYIKSNQIELNKAVYTELLALGFGPSIENYEHIYTY